MHASMVDTALEVAKHSQACMAYTQSDEISFVWYQPTLRSRIWFDGKHSKIVSQIAALTTLHFYRACLQHMPEYADKHPTFDARVFQVPTEGEALATFIWRERDATKNSLSMAASQFYSQAELYGKKSNDRQRMLLEKGVNWNDYNAHFKRGTYIQKHKVVRPFTTDEITRLPAEHQARTNPDLAIERNAYRILEMPPITRVENPIGVLLRGEDPMPKQEEK
jgi:tRNA(His) 5'-end guanylyltransferase